MKQYQKIIGEEAKRQLMEVEHRLPDAVVACVGGGSNAIGIFTDFIKEKDVRLIGVEPGGLGIETGEHGAPLGHGQEGIFFGGKILQYANARRTDQRVIFHFRRP